LYEDWRFQSLGSKSVDVIQYDAIVIGRIRDDVVGSGVYLT
jgi:hypothetical protein